MTFDEELNKMSMSDAVIRDTFCDSSFTARHNFETGARWALDSSVVRDMAEALRGSANAENCAGRIADNERALAAYDLAKAGGAG